MFKDEWLPILYAAEMEYQCQYMNTISIVQRLDDHALGFLKDCVCVCVLNSRKLLARDAGVLSVSKQLLQVEMTFCLSEPGKIPNQQ